MNQNYNYYPVNNLNRMQQQPQMGYLKGRQVTSLEEVKATPIDFDGSVFYFPDTANKRIYTKQIGMDGTALLNLYELKEMPLEQANMNGYVTREEFENAIKSFENALTQLTEKNEPKAQNQFQF